MAYEPYVTPEYYQTEYEGSAVPTDELKKGSPPGQPPY